ncbi:MAG: hypothetical protein C0601_13350 [Candidatus Muiribacterium halophilum]|uniref:ABC transmembrane type-2 domain-containing protein n=1 Tax=Muiribacterium halophilum TaxID=2053465 RepID=A0A2N5Z9F4_MUIH1|nr:MAG: hypothetical protein C0601_13350 [Candidatus Muirbacterium halophilum]
MRFRRVKAIAKKEGIHILRDPRSLLLGIVIPLLLLFLFGYALNMDVENISIAIVNLDSGTQSENIISLFQGSKYFDVKDVYYNPVNVDEMLKRGDIYAAFVIGRDLKQLQLIIDGADSTTSGIALGYIQSLLGKYSVSTRSYDSDSLTVDNRIRVWFNSEMKSRNFIVPGLIAVIMMIIAALLTSLAIAREFETGTMEGLIPTPLTAGEIIIGKLLPYISIGFFDMVICLLAGIYLFDIPMRGNVILLLFSGLIFITGGLSFGLFISAATRTQVLASQLSMVATFLPAFLLSGFVFDIANMPVPIQILTRIISARYFITLIKGIMLKGLGLDYLFPELLFLIVFCIVVLKACHKKLMQGMAGSV